MLAFLAAFTLSTFAQDVVVNVNLTMLNVTAGNEDDILSCLTVAALYEHRFFAESTKSRRS